MLQYTVKYEIEDDGESPREAAESVAKHLAEYASEAVYDVTGPDGRTVRVDLREPPEPVVDSKVLRAWLAEQNKELLVLMAEDAIDRLVELGELVVDEPEPFEPCPFDEPDTSPAELGLGELRWADTGRELGIPF